MAQGKAGGLLFFLLMAATVSAVQSTSVSPSRPVLYGAAPAGYSFSQYDYLAYPDNPAAWSTWGGGYGAFFTSPMGTRFSVGVKVRSYLKKTDAAVYLAQVYESYYWKPENTPALCNPAVAFDAFSFPAVKTVQEMANQIRSRQPDAPVAGKLQALADFYLQVETLARQKVGPYFRAPQIGIAQLARRTYADESSAQKAVSAALAGTDYAGNLQGFLRIISRDYACISRTGAEELSGQYVAALYGGSKRKDAPSSGVVREFSIPSKVADNAVGPDGQDGARPDSQFTYRNLRLLQGEKGFEFYARFSQPVQSYTLQAIRIASPDLSEITDAAKRAAKELTVVSDTPAGSTRSFSETGGIALTEGLAEGIYKIRLDTRTARGTVATFWQPQSGDGMKNDRLLDGVLVITKTQRYESLTDYAQTIEPALYRRLYPGRSESVLPLSKALQAARYQLSSQLQAMTSGKGDSSEFLYFFRLDRFAKAQMDVLKVTLEGDPARLQAAKTRIYQDVWKQKLPYYLSLEKRLLDKKIALCGESLLDKSILTADFYSSLMTSMKGQGSCGTQGQTLDDIQFQKAYVDYLAIQVAQYAVETKRAADNGQAPAQTLEQKVRQLNSGFGAYLRKVRDDADRALTKVRKDYAAKNPSKADSRTDNEKLIVSVPILDFSRNIINPPSFQAKVRITEKTCDNVNAISEDAETYRKKATGNGLFRSVDFGEGFLTGAEPFNRIDYSGLQLLQSFCLPYSRMKMAAKLLKSPGLRNVESQVPPSWVLSASKPDFSSENAVLNSGSLTRLSSEAKALQDAEVYQLATNLNRQTADSASVSDFDFNKCIAPYSSPAFVASSAVFAFALEIPGAAVVVGPLQDTLLLHSAVALAANPRSSEAELWCQAGGLLLGVATSSSYQKLREVTKELKGKPSGSKGGQNDEALVASLEKAETRTEAGTPPLVEPVGMLENLEKAPGHEQPVASKTDLAEGAFCASPCSDASVPEGKGDDLQGAPNAPFAGTQFILEKAQLPDSAKPKIWLTPNGPGTVSRPYGYLRYENGQYYYDHAFQPNDAIVTRADGTFEQLAKSQSTLLHPGDSVAVADVQFKLPKSEPSIATAEKPPAENPSQSGPTAKELGAQVKTLSKKPLDVENTLVSEMALAQRVSADLGRNPASEYARNNAQAAVARLAEARAKAQGALDRLQREYDAAVRDGAPGDDSFRINMDKGRKRLEQADALEKQMQDALSAETARPQRLEAPAGASLAEVAPSELPAPGKDRILGGTGRFLDSLLSNFRATLGNPPYVNVRNVFGTYQFSLKTGGSPAPRLRYLYKGKAVDAELNTGGQNVPKGVDNVQVQFGDKAYSIDLPQ